MEKKQYKRSTGAKTPSRKKHTQVDLKMSQFSAKSVLKK
jgi:hypothetical protein